MHLISVFFSVSLCAGTVLALIDYSDPVFLCHHMQALDWVEPSITSCVPYFVSTFGVRFPPEVLPDRGRRSTLCY